MAKKLSLKNHDFEMRLFMQRTIIMVVILLLFITCLISRLVYLQVWQHNLYTTLSKENQLSVIPIAPKRGLIFDRNGVLLAENIPVYSLDIIPSKVKHLHKAIKELQKIISINQTDVQGFFKLIKQHRPFQPVPLKIDLSSKEVAIFEVNRWRFPGVIVDARLMRYYPMGKALADVVGFMGRISPAELRQVNAENYSATNYIGKVGIEKYYEKILHGKVGYQQVEIDASGRIVRVLKRTPPIAGDNIYLTIDSGLEKIAEKALANNQGAVVAIQPSTGEILAMVSTPSYNPNRLVKGLSQKAYEKLLHAPGKPLYNRTIRGLYAPGSTVKPYYALEGLATHNITPTSKIFDPGYLIYGGHVFHGWDRAGHGWVNVTKAIVVSCDIFFYNLALKMGMHDIDHILHAFGFGQTTNIDMGEELPGVLPTPKWKLRHFGEPWYSGDTIISGIGQGYILATPLQMAAAVATLAEHGKRFQPHLLQKLITPSGNSETIIPTQLNSVNLPAWDWHVVIHAMEGVIHDPDGTGFRFGRNPPYSVAAKTGTAQVYTVNKHSVYNEDDLPKKLRDNSLFIAFAPVNNPKIAVAVVVEHSDIAPTVARKVMNYYLLTEHHLSAVRINKPLIQQNLPAKNIG